MSIKNIPQTTVSTYISGIHSLNLTNPIYGYYGVANREERLNKLGLKIKKVYVANHHRAILDLVFDSLTRYNRIGYAKGCVRDFFFDSKNAQQLFNQLIQMVNYLDEDNKEVLNEWLSREFRPIYKARQARAIQSGTDIFDVFNIDENIEVLWG